MKVTKMAFKTIVGAFSWNNAILEKNAVYNSVLGVIPWIHVQYNTAKNYNNIFSVIVVLLQS